MNKKNLQKIVLALALPVLYVLLATGFHSVSEKSFVKASGAMVTGVKDFLNIIFNVKYGGVPEQNWVERNLDMYGDSLNYNAIQIYDEGSSRFGTFDSTLRSDQIQNVRDLMTEIENKDLKGIYARTKIFRLAEGQRLEYEVSPNGSTTINDGFCYQNVMYNTYTTDTSRTVLSPKVGIDSADWLCKNIYENMQHSDYINGKDRGDWFLKPMMRINQSDFDSTSSTPVVAIVTQNFDGTKIDSVIIRIRNFRDSANTYGGNYINKFNFLNEFPFVDLTISGDTITSGLNHGNNGDLESSRIDFKVYWFGIVDVWFDKMVVDDEMGNELFRGNFDDEISDEVTHFTNEPSNYTFYCDEVVYSQIPCLEYIKNKMLEYDTDSRLSFVMSNSQNRYSMRNDSVAYSTALNRVKPKIFFTDPYLIPWEIPDNLNFPGAVRLSPSAYNDTIQRVFGHKNGELSEYDDSFIRQINITRNNMHVNSPESKFFVIPQLFGHMVKSNSTGEFVKSGNREPTNEELQAQAMISISHGAEGLGWYVYQNTEWQGNTLSVNSAGGHHYLNNNLSELPFDYTHFNFGLFNIDSTKRTSNVTGQNKWDYVSKMNRTVLHWKPTLDKISWLGGYSVHSENAGHEFISDIKSIYRIPSAPFNFSPSNEDALKYWEMGFFDPDFNNPSVDQYDKSKYFIMVNRRCVPDTPNYGIGDVRMLKIKFDTTVLNQFNNWRITDVNTGDTMTFNVKNQGSGGFLDLGGNLNSMGYFNPGEGKLFKLAPVMQEGGTLVADEEVQGITFVCNAPVYNNGKNISILEGTKIEFKSGAGINMNGGSLICSNSSTNTQENVLLKGYNGQTWNGISMENTYKSKIQRTRFEDTKKPLTIESSSESTLFSGKIIRRNYFKLTGDSSTALTIYNQHNLSIDSNTFDITSYENTAGIYLINNISTELEVFPAASGQDDPEDVSAGYINITKNRFSGSYFPLMINDMGSNYSSYYIYNNEFVNTGLFGITARKISGIIKQNRFTDEAQNYCLYLIESFPDMPANIFRSEKRNIVLTNSFPMLAPIRNENGQLIFKGGRNSLIITTNSEPAENICLKYSLPDIKLGENNFAIGNSYSYHIFGSIPPEGERYYNAIRNCWEGYNDLPSIFLFQGNDTSRLGYNYIPVSCIPSEETAIETQGIGFGIIDSTIITAYDSTDILSDDESLFYGAIEFKETGNYTEAIADFKALIDTHDSSEFIYSALDNLYSCYQAIDTSSDEEITDVLYSDLKQYLETKIRSDNYDEDFEKNAYSFSLMCDTRLTNYNEALSGYEFIATYDPDAEQRLMASWEYENIQDMMNGEGGGKRNLEFGISDLEFEKTVEKRIKKLDEFVDRDPIKRHIKEEYVKTAKENENSKTVREGIYAQKNPNEEKLIERSRQNIYGSKNLSKQQKEVRRFEDMKLLLNPENLEVNKNIENALPVEYSLSQNYPNPFNPISHLEFGISDLGFVSLKVYDVLGREIKTLVNVIKPAGRFKIEFDGSNFASGVYFYRLEAGDFVQTKRMVLIK